MANQQHINWLLEGVETWNARRERDGFRHDFNGADLQKALKDAGMVTKTGGADLREADLRQADLRGANLRGVDLREADLLEADLWGANLREENLWGADLREAIITSIKWASGIKNTAGADFTNLSQCRNLTKDQLETMDGDTGVILPKGWKHPAHWPKWETKAPPTLPKDQKAGDKIDLSQDRLTLGIDPAPPLRSDLESIFDDIRHSATDLKSLGNIGNMSQVFASALDRFLATLPENYIDLEQVRFAVGAKSLRLRFESEKVDLEQTAPEKIGHIKAILYAADLLVARLPEWRAFLAEETSEYEIIAADPEAAEAILSEAAEQLENAPETFDTSLFRRIREYLDTKSIEGYLAGQALLTNIAHKTFVMVTSLVKETVSEARKLTIIGIAIALNTHLGAILKRLTELLPKELEWLANWLEYLPKFLG